MATYKKPTIVVIGDTVSGGNFIGDAETYEALKARKTAKVYLGKKPPAGETPEMNTYVPFHAVQIYAKVVSAEDATKADPYGCEDGSNKVRFINDGTPCGDGSVVAEFIVPVTITEDNYPVVKGCGDFTFRGWKDEESNDLGARPVTIEEPITYHSFFTPIY